MGEVYSLTAEKISSEVSENIEDCKNLAVLKCEVEGAKNKTILAHQLWNQESNDDINTRKEQIIPDPSFKNGAF